MLTYDELFGPEAQQLEDTVRTLVQRYKAAREGSAEHRFVERQLQGIRAGSELGMLIIEDFECGEECLFLPAVV